MSVNNDDNNLNDPELEYEILNDAISYYKKTMSEQTSSPKFLLNKNSIFNRLKFVDLILIDNDSLFLDLKIKLEINSTRNKKTKMFDQKNVIQFTNFFELTNSILKKLNKNPQSYSIAFFRENLEKISSDMEILNYYGDILYVKLSEKNNKKKNLIDNSIRYMNNTIKNSNYINNNNTFNKTNTNFINFNKKKELKEKLNYLIKDINGLYSINKKDLKKKSIRKASNGDIKKISNINYDFEIKASLKDLNDIRETNGNYLNQITEIKNKNEIENENINTTNVIFNEFDNNNANYKTIIMKEINVDDNLNDTYNENDNINCNYNNNNNLKNDYNNETNNNNNNETVLNEENIFNSNNNNIINPYNESIKNSRKESRESISNDNDIKDTLFDAHKSDSDCSPNNNSYRVSKKNSLKNINKNSNKHLKLLDNSMKKNKQIDISNSIIKDNLKKKDIFSMEIIDLNETKIKDSNYINEKEKMKIKEIENQSKYLKIDYYINQETIDIKDSEKDKSINEKNLKMRREKNLFKYDDKDYKEAENKKNNLSIIKLKDEKNIKIYREDNLNLEDENSYLLTNQSFSEKIKARDSAIENKNGISISKSNEFNRDDFFDKLSKPKLYITDKKFYNNENNNSNNSNNISNNNINIINNYNSINIDNINNNNYETGKEFNSITDKFLENNCNDFFHKKINNNNSKNKENKRYTKVVYDTNNNYNNNNNNNININNSNNLKTQIKNNDFDYKEKVINNQINNININNSNNSIFKNTFYNINDFKSHETSKPKNTLDKTIKMNIYSQKFLQSFFKENKINNKNNNKNPLQISKFNFYSAQKTSFTKTMNTFSKFSNMNISNGNWNHNNNNTNNNENNTNNNFKNINNLTKSIINLENYVPTLKSSFENRNRNKFSFRNSLNILNPNSKKFNKENPNTKSENFSNLIKLNEIKDKNKLDKIKEFLDIEDDNYNKVKNEKEKKNEFEDFFINQNYNSNKFKLNIKSMNNKVSSYKTKENNIDFQIKKKDSKEQFYEKIAFDLNSTRQEFRRFKSKSEMRFTYMNYPTLDKKTENEVKKTRELIKNFMKNNLNSLIPNDFIDENLKEIMINNIFKQKLKREKEKLIKKDSQNNNNKINNNNVNISNFSDENIYVKSLDFKSDNISNHIMSIQMNPNPEIISLSKIDYDSIKEFLFLNFLNSRSMEKYFNKRINNNEITIINQEKMINTSLMFLNNNKNLNYTNLNSTATIEENWFNSKNHKLALELFNLSNNSKQVSDLNLIVGDLISKLKKDISAFINYLNFLSKNKMNLQLKNMALDLIFINLYMIEVDKKLIDQKIVFLFVEFISDEKEKKMFYEDFKRLKIIGVEIVDENVEFYRYQFLLLKRFLKMITRTSEENLDVVKKEFSITDEEIYFILFSKKNDIKRIVNDIYFVNKITNVFRILVSSIN